MRAVKLVSAIRSWRRSLAAAALMAIALPSSNGLAEDAPKKIIAAGGAITEILYAIGAQSLLVGVDTTSLHPPEALKSHPNIGYVRALSAEGVLSLAPTLMIASAHAGPPAAIDMVRAAGVTIGSVPEPDSAEAILMNIRLVGKYSDHAAAAAKLERVVADRFVRLRETTAKASRRKRVLFILSLQNGRVLAGGRKTSADLMIHLAGAANAVDQFEGFKTMTDEAIIAIAPEVILTISRAGQELSSDTLFAQPALAATPAAATRSHLNMDALFLLGLGPRTPDAALELFGRLYPDAAKAAP